MAGIDYTPPASLARLFSEPRFYNVVIGPVGSTKTTACIMFLLWQAMRQEPGPDGRRVTRYAISRNTLVEMRMTIMRDIQFLLGPLAKFRSTENLAVLDFEWQNTRVNSEWFFIPLDRPEDEARLLSTQFSGVWFNEAREVPWRLVVPAAGRCGRWPPQRYVPCTFPFVLMDSNPPAMGSEMWEFLEVNPPKTADGEPLLTFVRQPSARSPEADWLYWLPPNYYDNLIAGQSEEWVRVHVDGEYGRDPSGLAVFDGVFSAVRHVSQTPLKVLRDRPLIVGLDPGLNPAAVAGQLGPDGQWRVLREAYGEASGLQRFLEHKVQLWLTEPDLAMLPVQVFVDPAAAARDGLTASTALADIRRIFPAAAAPTNAIEPRIAALEDVMLNVTPDGGPRLLIDATQCPTLIRALRYEYIFRRRRDGQARPLPEKLHPWSDVVDALGYMILGWGGGGGQRRLRRAPTTWAEVSAPGMGAWV